VLLPAIGAAIAHAPVLRFDLFSALARPIDGGRTFRGRRLLGDNKTWRGAAFMGGGVLASSVALHRFPRYHARLPAELRAMPAGTFGAALALGTVAGELPNSFLKRQLGIAPGTQRRSPAGIALSVFDQGDFTLGVWLALRRSWTPSLRQAIDAFATVAAVHAVINVIGYAIGARRSPV
jgi:CDP-2,3-bis-(O-geranylgeranyl)-sn-glycerol synthase